MTKHETVWVVNDIQRSSTQAAYRAAHVVRLAAASLLQQQIRHLCALPISAETTAQIDLLYPLVMQIFDLNTNALAEMSLEGLPDYAKFYQASEPLPAGSTL